MNLQKNMKLLIVMIGVNLAITIFINIFRVILGSIMSGQGGWYETNVENMYVVLKTFLIVLGGQIFGIILYQHHGKKLTEKAEIKFGRNASLCLFLGGVLGMITTFWIYSSYQPLAYILFDTSIIALVSAPGLFSGYRLSEVFDGLEAKA